VLADKINKNKFLQRADDPAIRCKTLLGAHYVLEKYVLKVTVQVQTQVDKFFCKYLIEIFFPLKNVLNLFCPSEGEYDLHNFKVLYQKILYR
jgi:hypothetical protein